MMQIRFADPEDAMTVAEIHEGGRDALFLPTGDLGAKALF
jgi:hypothetical protein